MRARNDTPTVLEFAYLFGPTIKEVLKELTDCGYHYFTGSGSHYERSDQLPLQFEDLPIIPKPLAVTMVTKDQVILCHWRDSFGKSVRQLTVQNQSTKTTLERFLCMPTCLLLLSLFRLYLKKPQQLLTLSNCCRLGIFKHERDDRTLLYPADSVVLLKPGYPPDLQITAPFSLDIITDDVIKDDHCYSVEVTFFLPSFDDCLTFCPRANVTIHRDAVVIQVEGANNDEKVIKLSNEDFSALKSGTCKKTPIPYLKMAKTTVMILKVKGVKIISLFW